MSISTSGTTYTYVSGSTINAGGAEKMMGGREMLMPTSALAVVGIGRKITNAKRIGPRNNFFILQPPFYPLWIPNLTSSGLCSRNALLARLQSR
jgi:hypothetical protein